MNKIVLALVFILAGVLFVHNLTSINADIGRHIKIGEIIWETNFGEGSGAKPGISVEVPKTNSFSYTVPDFPFTNHHWLSEVIFYQVFKVADGWLSGLRAIIIFKVAVLFATYFILYLTVKKHSIFAISLSFLVSIFVFSARTEPRPEIFSYLIFAAYLLIIYKARLSNISKRTLLVLPLLQIFWVNLHIYFAIGPIIYLLFLIERIANKKIIRFEFLVFGLILLANLINPNFLNGALYPFKVLNNYGYSVAENS